MSGLATLAILLLLATSAPAQSTTTPSPLTQRFTTILARADSGHSPAPEDLAATADPSQPIPDPASITQALPLILRALDSKDPQLRMYALLTLQAFRSGESNPVYKPAVARALTPAIPQIATHLTDESSENAAFTTIILGGFAPDPPASVYPPLIAFLKRDDAISPTGLAVVIDILGLGPIPNDAAEAVARYLRRSDQTYDSRANLIDAITTQPRQSVTVNNALLHWLDSDDNSLRARVILSLPQLDLAPDTYGDTHARISALAQNDSENLQVVTAAKEIAPCWTSVRMSTPCPIYETPGTPAAKN